MKDQKLIPFAPILVESTRSIGYSFESALADIIDNSIGKGASTVDVIFDSNPPQYIAIIDDAAGMSYKELVDAMRYGSCSSLETRDSKDLGRFGLGLKTASLSQCRKLTVISKQKGQINAVQWDLDHIIETEDWNLNCFSEDETKELDFSKELDNYESGTVVLWENFDRMLNGATDQQKVFDEKLSIAQQHIALVFHRLLGEEMGAFRVKIRFNGHKVKPVDPFLSSLHGTQVIPEQFLKIGGESIVVKPYILPHVSKITQDEKKQLGDLDDLRKNQGFYIYRNKRLIIWGTWFRLIKQQELTKLARVRVDIPNSLDDYWEIDVKKSTASLPDTIKDGLKSIVEQAITRSEAVIEHRGRRIKNDNLQHVWDVIKNRDSFQYQINRELPLYCKLESCLDEKDLHFLDSFITAIEDAFPFGDVYYRMAKYENGIPGSSLDFEKAYATGIDLISSMKAAGSDIQTILASIGNIDLLSKYPKVIEKLKENFQK